MNQRWSRKWRGALLVLAAIIASSIAISPASAQSPKQDARKFTLTHFEAHGEWEVFCGHFGDKASRLCELRRTDIFGRRPFRAMVVFIRYRAAGPQIRLDTERSTLWTGGGLLVNGALAVPVAQCLIGDCLLSVKQTTAFLRQLDGAKSAGVSFRLLTTARQQDWNIRDLRAGLAALEKQRRRFQLP